MAKTLEEIIEENRPTLEDIVRQETEAARPTAGTRAMELIGKVTHAPDQLLSQLPPYRAIKSTFSPVLEGFNTQFANTMGLPVEMVNEAMSYAKMDFLDNPGNAMDSVRKAFKAFGVKTYSGEAEGLLQKIGEEGFRQALFFGALRAAAPTMAAPSRVAPTQATIGEPIMQPGFNRGPGPIAPVAEGGPFMAPIAEMGTQMGRAAIEKPMTTAVGAGGASVGIPVGGNLGETGGNILGPMLTDDPTTQGVIAETGKTLGEFKGGMAGAIASTYAGTKMRVIPRAERPSIRPRSEPVISPLADPEIARARAGEMLQRTLTAMDRELTENVAAVGAKLRAGDDPAKYGAELQHRISIVKDQARAIQKEAYDRVPNLPIVPNETANAVEAMLNDTKIPLQNKPIAILNDLRNLLGMEAFDSGNLHVNKPTFKQLNEFRRTIQDLRWGTKANPVTGTPANQHLGERLQVLEDAIFKDMENSLGDHVDGWRFASNLTKQLNDRFTRGPIGQLLGLDHQSTERVRPEDAARFLLSKPGGMPAVVEAGGPLPKAGTDYHIDEFGKSSATTVRPGYYDPKTGRFVGSNQPEGTKDMLTAADQAIRSEFLGAAEQAALAQYGTPEKAQEAAAKGGAQWFNRVKRDIELWTRTYSDIKDTVSKNEKIITQKREWERGTFAQYHDRKNPDEAVANLLANPKPTEEVRRLIVGMKLKDGTRDEDAVKGLGRAMMDHLIANSSSPENAMTKLANTRMRGAYEAAWGEDGLARVERILTAAAAAKQQDLEIAKGPVRSVLGAISGVLANWGGHLAAAASPGGGYGQLRYPAVFGRKANAILESIYQVSNPMALMSAAVYDPAAESILMTRLPENITESYQFLKKIRAFNTLQEMTYNKSMKDYMLRYKREQEEGPQVPQSR